MTIRDAISYFFHQILTTYEPREAQNIVEISLQHIIQCSRLHLILYSKQLLNQEQIEKMYSFINLLLKHYPVQYLIGSTQFCGLSINCSPDALIPRQETEELVAWIVEICKAKKNDNITILDIGTGTGCIALALKHQLPKSIIKGIDVNEAAIELAQQNAKKLQLSVQFLIEDLFIQSSNETKDFFDVIVSNPPYIPKKEKEIISLQVIDHEPHTALFVLDNNPLVFYEAIAQCAQICLKKNGILFVETHEQYAVQVAQLFKEQFFNEIEIRKDINGKNRMVKATKSV